MNGVCYEPLLRDMTWSFSRLSCYEDCPYRWYLRYLMDCPDEDRFYSSYGRFCHELIAGFYTGKYTKDRLLPEFLCGFSAEVTGERPDPKTVRRWLDQGAVYFEKFEPFPYKTLEVERKADFTVGDAQFTGVIDLLGRADDGSLVLVDHKSADLKPRSGRKKPTLSDRKLDDTLRQLYLYCIWVKDTYGEYPAFLDLNCFRTGTLIHEKFDPERLEEAKRWVLDTRARLFSDSDFIPNDDYFVCRWICGQHEHCELYEEEYRRK